jgi:hypothetical protein
MLGKVEEYKVSYKLGKVRLSVVCQERVGMPAALSNQVEGYLH